MLLTLLAVLAPALHAADEIRSQRVQFAKGATSAVVKGSIAGYEIVDYLVGVSAGQHMKVDMTTGNTASYFNVMEPGETEVAIFNGSVSDNRFEGTLAKSGDYGIRVYMMRSAARRNERANYQLSIAIAAVAGQPTGGMASSATSSAAGAASGHFDATGSVPCAQHKDQPMAQCKFGVTRAGGGNATVSVTRPDGSRRTIVFVDGAARSADTSESEGQLLFKASKQGDLNLIHVGDERYEIPDAVVSGG